MNPDDVIPGDYNLPMARNDYNNQRLHYRVVRKIPKLTGAVTYNEKGNKGRLLITVIGARSPRICSLVDFNANAHVFQADVAAHVEGDFTE